MTCNTNVSCTESDRQNLCMILFLLNIIQILFAIFCFALGAYISLSVNQKAHLAKGNSVKPIGGVLCWCSVIMFVLHCVSAKISNNCCYFMMRHRFQNKLLIIATGYVIMSLVLLITPIFCLVKSSRLKEVLSHGLLGAIKLYGKDSNRKRDFDDIQIEYKCCGSSNHTDWFRVRWMPESSVPSKDDTVFSRTEYLHSVPFSCCDPSHAGPCFHHLVKTDRGAYKYPNHGFFQRGCTEVLLDELQDVLLGTAIFVLVPFCLELILAILTRYLQTSLDDCERRDDSSDVGVGTLIGKHASQRDSFKHNQQEVLSLSDDETAFYVDKENTRELDRNLRRILNDSGGEKANDADYSIVATCGSENAKVRKTISQKESKNLSRNNQSNAERNIRDEYEKKRGKKEKTILLKSSQKGRKETARKKYSDRGVSEDFNVYASREVLKENRPIYVDSQTLTSSSSEGCETSEALLKQRGKNMKIGYDPSDVRLGMPVGKHASQRDSCKSDQQNALGLSDDKTALYVTDRKQSWELDRDLRKILDVSGGKNGNDTDCSVVAICGSDDRVQKSALYKNKPICVDSAASTSSNSEDSETCEPLLKPRGKDAKIQNYPSDIDVGALIRNHASQKNSLNNDQQEVLALSGGKATVSVTGRKSTRESDRDLRKIGNASSRNKLNDIDYYGVAATVGIEDDQMGKPLSLEEHETLRKDDQMTTERSIRNEYEKKKNNEKKADLVKSARKETNRKNYPTEEVSEDFNVYTSLNKSKLVHVDSESLTSSSNEGHGTFEPLQNQNAKNTKMVREKISDNKTQKVLAHEKKIDSVKKKKKTDLLNENKIDSEKKYDRKKM